MASQGALAKKETKLHITLMDFHPWVLDMLEGVLEENLSLPLIREPNSGKSPLGKMRLSSTRRRHAGVYRLGIVVVCIRVTHDLIVLHGEDLPFPWVTFLMMTACTRCR